MTKCKIYAHRGLSGRLPENTIIAFEAAMRSVADGIELDVQLSKDGVPVVIHDETLERLSNYSGYVKDYNLQELKKIDIGSWFDKKYGKETIPTLEEYLFLVKEWSGITNIELKNSIVDYPGMEEKVSELLKKTKLEDKVLISGFNWASLEKFKAISPNVKIGVLYNKGAAITTSECIKLGAYSVHPNQNDVTAELVRNFAEIRIPVITYTVNSKERLMELVKMGVSGIFTDYADELAL